MAAIILIANSVCSRSMASEPQVLTFAYPPMVAENGGAAGGPVTEMLQLSLQKAGLTSAIELVSLQKVLSRIDSGNTIGFMIARTPAREDKYKWVVRVNQDSMRFAVLKGKPRIDSIDQAKSVGRIGVTAGSVTEKTLRDAGLNNLDPAAGVAQHVTKLFGGRIDAWFAFESLMPWALGQHGKSLADVDAGEPTVTVDLWVVASLDVPDEVIARIRTAFEELGGEKALKDRLRN